MFRIEHDYPHRTVDIRFFRCAVADAAAPIHPREGQDYQWAPLDGLDRIDLLPADAPLADFLRRTAR